MLPVSEESDWQDVIIDLKSNPNWSGTVTQLRICPAIDASTGDYFEIELIEFVRNTTTTISIETISVIEP